MPAHFWVPDVTDGTPTPVAAFLTTLPKIGGARSPPTGSSTRRYPTVASTGRCCSPSLAAASMTLGNLAAFFQTTVKRLLAYSTISQVGYLLIAVAVAGRPATSPSRACCSTSPPTRSRTSARSPWSPHLPARPDTRRLPRPGPPPPVLAAVLVVCLLGLVGTPPTAVFVGKLEVFTAAIDGRYAWLAVLAVVNTVASLFYYLRWLAPAFQAAPGPGPVDPLAPAGGWSATAAYTAGTVALVLGVASGLALPLTTGPLLP